MINKQKITNNTRTKNALLNKEYNTKTNTIFYEEASYFNQPKGSSIQPDDQKVVDIFFQPGFLIVLNTNNF